jgi:hypothetical protein
LLLFDENNREDAKSAKKDAKKRITVAEKGVRTNCIDISH